MDKFIKLHDDGGKEVLVNPRYIGHVEERQSRAGCKQTVMIVMGIQLGFTETLEEVEEKLRQAGWGDENIT